MRWTMRLEGSKGLEVSSCRAMLEGSATVAGRLAHRSDSGNAHTYDESEVRLLLGRNRWHARKFAAIEWRMRREDLSCFRQPFRGAACTREAAQPFRSVSTASAAPSTSRKSNGIVTRVGLDLFPSAGGLSVATQAIPLAVQSVSAIVTTELATRAQ